MGLLTKTKQGVRLPGPLATITVAAAAGAQTLFQISNFAGQVGAKTYRIKKLLVNNYAGADVWLYVGTGVGGAFVQAMPRIRVVNNFNGAIAEDDLPDVEFNADITMWASAVTCEAQAEVEEIG